MPSLSPVSLNTYSLSTYFSGLREEYGKKDVDVELKINRIYGVTISEKNKNLHVEADA